MWVESESQRLSPSHESLLKKKAENLIKLCDLLRRNERKVAHHHFEIQQEKVDFRRGCRLSFKPIFS